MDPGKKAVPRWHEQASRKTCEILTFNTKKSKTASVVLPPNVSTLPLTVLLYDGLYVKIGFPQIRRGHLDRLLIILKKKKELAVTLDVKIAASPQEITVTLASITSPKKKKVILTAAYGMKERGSENGLEQQILHSSLHNGWLQGGYCGKHCETAALMVLKLLSKAISD